MVQSGGVWDMCLGGGGTTYSYVCDDLEDCHLGFVADGTCTSTPLLTIPFRHAVAGSSYMKTQSILLRVTV